MSLALIVNFKSDEEATRATARAVEAFGRAAPVPRASCSRPDEVAAMFRAVDQIARAGELAGMFRVQVAKVFSEVAEMFRAQGLLGVAARPADRSPR